jgi:hypothetical protein
MPINNDRQTKTAIAAGLISPVAGLSLLSGDKQFTEAIPGRADKQVDLLTKSCAQTSRAAIRPLRHIPMVEKVT